MLSLRVFRIVWLAAFAASIAPSALAVQFDVVRAAYRVDSGYGTGTRDLDVRFFTGAFMPIACSRPSADGGFAALNPRP